MDGFASIAYPLTSLTQQSMKFEWQEAYERIFKKLKDRPTSTPVLTIQEGAKGFVVYYDASRVGQGSMLMKHEYVVSYASR